MSLEGHFPETTMPEIDPLRGSLEGRSCRILEYRGLAFSVFPFLKACEPLIKHWCRNGASLFWAQAQLLLTAGWIALGKVSSKPQFPSL